MPIPVTAMAEDQLNVAIIKRLLREFDGKYCLVNGNVIDTGGTGNLDKILSKWNNAAQNTQKMYFILRDMDALAAPEDERYCPESKISALLKNSRKHDNLLLRIAVAEGENWLLADYERLCGFLRAQPRGGVTADKISDGKEAVVNIARRSRIREYREGAAPAPGSVVKTGNRYNEIMRDFISGHWDPREAARRSRSLRRTLARLEQFTL